jgi:hypothetical protein
VTGAAAGALAARASWLARAPDRRCIFNFLTAGAGPGAAVTQALRLRVPSAGRRFTEVQVRAAATRSRLPARRRRATESEDSDSGPPGRRLGGPARNGILGVTVRVLTPAAAAFQLPRTRKFQVQVNLNLPRPGQQSR